MGFLAWTCKKCRNEYAPTFTPSEYDFSTDICQYCFDQYGPEVYVMVVDR